VKTARLVGTAQSTASYALFLLRRQPRNCEDVTLVARLREHSSFQGFWSIFFVAYLSQKGVSIHKNHSRLLKGCRHSVKSRAVTCPLKQSNMSAWSLLS